MAKKSDIVKFTKKQKYEVRNINRCILCGKSKGYIRKFALCRICFREKVISGEIPGVKKVSW
jgi:small subunit ribosomal protein S14